MATLEKRVDALEVRGHGRTPDLIVMHTIVSPGKVGLPVRAATVDGQRYVMSPGETEGEFVARIGDAARERRRLSGNRHPLVFLTSTDEDL